MQNNAPASYGQLQRRLIECIHDMPSRVCPPKMVPSGDSKKAHKKLFNILRYQ